MSSARILLKVRRARPFFGMHPWVYAGAIDAVEGEPKDGDVVDLVSHAGNFIARGLLQQPKQDSRPPFYLECRGCARRRLFSPPARNAIRLRRDLLGLMGQGQACRVVFSEADGLSGLTVDRFDRWLVVQFTSLGLAQRREMFADLLAELLQPAGIYLRTERGIGQLEGLDLHDGPLRGHAPAGPIEIDEHGLRLRVNLAEGQKTGYYLDQRDNRQAVARLAAGRRMLDAFCYSGGFGLHAARAGATAVLGVDASEPALELARANAELNGLTNLAFEKADLFPYLDRLVAESNRFGLIVLDPPKFARHRRGGRGSPARLSAAARANAQAARTGGHPGDVLLLRADHPRDVARPARRGIVARPPASANPRKPRRPPDHPVSAACPETSYLKCVICRLGE